MRTVIHAAISRSGIGKVICLDNIRFERRFSVRQYKIDKPIGGICGYNLGMHPPHHPPELYISVDVETAGPNPSQYSLLSIGACTVDERRLTFYVEIKPVNQAITPQAWAIHGLDLTALAEMGMPPEEAMLAFEKWVLEVTPAGYQPVFVGFNAPFDWMFVNDYFHRYLGRNPFGHTALDIKALYMGARGVPWSETTKRHLSSRYLDGRQISHNALNDALDQAQIFERLLAEIEAARGQSRG